MSQYEVIRDVEESIKELLKARFEAAGFKSVHFYSDIPSTDKIKKLPGVSFYLYNVSSDERYREREQYLVSEADEAGQIHEFYQDSPLPLHLHFALSTFAETPQEEHILLGFAMKILLEHPTMETGHLKGNSWEEGDRFSLMIRHDTSFDEVNALWRGVGEHIRPTAFYWVPIALKSERVASQIEPVEEKEIGVLSR
jgi:hypothetical protein